ncbi:glycosyltransferase family 1 protein [Blastomonas sp. AAP53]|uniref:glycosyltransferase family 4 protein n=1 Tax=Blastomonas sp. AAP53 TaxID=1248760 RepID=UPI0003091F60|nr:glycosyltransferase family 1 protein [Blastomonas sp. AAP53]
MKIAMRLSEPEKWTGGVNYLFNMAQAVRQHDASTAFQVFISAHNVAGYRDRATATCGVAPMVLEETSKITVAKALVGIHDQSVIQTFRQAGVDVYFEASGYIGPSPGVPVISWLPDFQHRHLPGLFSKKAWWLREVRFRRIIQSRAHIMLSSEDAYNDLLNFYGKPQGQVHVVPFAVLPPKGATWDSGEQVRIELGLPERFIFLPNQFWLHKNHGLIVHALAQMGDAAPCIAASGSGKDDRAPGHFDHLLQRIASHGLESKFRILGAIPFSSVLALNARADALINPSLFEGWSTTVEEAKALGTPLVLSNLDVHREQAGDRALYFDPHSPQSCAEALARVEPRPRWQPGETLKDGAGALSSFEAFGQLASNVFSKVRSC